MDVITVVAVDEANQLCAGIAVCFRTPVTVLHESFRTIWVTLALRHIFSQLPFLHPVPTDDPSPPKSWGLPFTHLRAPAPDGWFLFTSLAKARADCGGRGRQHKDGGTMKTCGRGLRPKYSSIWGPKHKH